ncbi:MAG TPA: hypothetical protein VJ770_25390 [Stellaceae bacterium]|nr:hypothetical protein [Stellaceae bacterium]
MQRALGEQGTPARRRELADALASWAATWQALPAGENSGNGTLRPVEAIELVPLVPAERRRAGNIVAGLQALGEVPEFAPVTGMLDVSGRPERVLAEAAGVFARV